MNRDKPGFDRRALAPGSATVWEYWTVKHGAHIEPYSCETEALALAAVAELKGIGTPGPYSIRHHLVIEHLGPEQPVEDRLTVGAVSGP